MNLAYSPTKEEKKFYAKRIRKLVDHFKGLGYNQSEIEEEVVQDASKFLTFVYSETIIISFQYAMEVREMVWGLIRAE